MLVETLVHLLGLHLVTLLYDVCAKPMPLLNVDTISTNPPLQRLDYLVTVKLGLVFTNA